MGIVGENSKVDKLSHQQKQCLLMVADLQSSKEIARQLGITPNTVDNRLKRAQVLLGAHSRAEAAKILSATLISADILSEFKCQSLAGQNSALAKAKYQRSSNGSSRQEDRPSADVGSQLHDIGIGYQPMSYSFETGPTSWMSLLANGELDNELGISARLFLIMALMITLAVSCALLVTLAEGLSRLF